MLLLPGFLLLFRMNTLPNRDILPIPYILDFPIFVRPTNCFLLLRIALLFRTVHTGGP
jgi:hypothetical protein